MPRNDVNLSSSRLGKRESGSVNRAVISTMEPEREARRAGSPAPLKIAEKLSPMTIVYCRLAEAHRVATKEEGTHEVDDPIVLAHASPHVLEPVASQTRATIAKQ